MTKLTESNQTNNERGDAYLLALRNQMADAGLVVQTVAEGDLTQQATVCRR